MTALLKILYVFCQVAVLTGADPYYCAGVNFGDAIRAGNPAKLHKMVKENNAAIFNAFIQVSSFTRWQTSLFNQL